MSLRGSPPTFPFSDANSSKRLLDMESSCTQVTSSKKTLRKIIIFLACVFLICWFLLAFYGTTFLDSQLERRVPRSVLTAYDDVGCNGIPLSERIEDLQRILGSVRKEVMDSSRKLEDVNNKYDDITKEIPVKQNELVQIKSEIENARSLLRDLYDRRNVRVSLPHVPLLPSTTVINAAGVAQHLSFETAIDYSRCSITSPLRIFVYPSSVDSPLTQSLSSSQYTTSNSSSACLFVYVHNGDSFSSSSLLYWGKDGTNHVIINIRGEINTTANAIVVQDHFRPRQFRPMVDYALHLHSLKRHSSSNWKELPQLLPYSRENIFTFIAREKWPRFEEDGKILVQSAKNSEDKIRMISCDNERECSTEKLRDAFNSSLFTVISPSKFFQSDLLHVLKCGSIPVILSMDQPIPFQDTIDWSLVSLRIPFARLPECHFILRSISMADALEMRKRGRNVLERLLGDTDALSRTLLASLSQRLFLPPISHSPVVATPLFHSSGLPSFTAPILNPVKEQSTSEAQYLGPLEASFASPSYLHNFTSISLYSHSRWNSLYSLGGAPEFLINDVDMPANSEYYEDTAVGFRPIGPGSGKDFSLALGGNRPKEQFTVVMLTYNRDEVLYASLERLHNCPYLNKIIVVWNNVERQPMGPWPQLNVPVEFIRGGRNSLNNRFIPWDRIETEAVFSMDDDIELMHQEIVLAFRTWREARTRIVGFPARKHVRYGDDYYYNSNHTCQLSMILTGAAFIHKSYLYAYHYAMPEVIRQHIDKVTNCEDVAMNFLVAHLTEQPPMKVTSKWTFKCTNCTESLWSDESHFIERHECIRLFIDIYGYNPLKYSQIRTNSILFKTRIPTEHQKCFTNV